MSFYHYCCEHSRAGIAATGTVLPRPFLWLPGDVLLSWWTDLARPDRYALGLTSRYLACDRTRFRFTAAAPAEDVKPWWLWARNNQVPQPIRDMLERGAAPRHWFVATVPIPVAVVA